MKKEHLSQIVNWINRLELASMDAFNAIKEFLITDNKEPLVSYFGAFQILHGRPDEAIKAMYKELKEEH